MTRRASSARQRLLGGDVIRRGSESVPVRRFGLPAVDHRMILPGAELLVRWRVKESGRLQFGAVCADPHER